MDSEDIPKSQLISMVHFLEKHDVEQKQENMEHPTDLQKKEKNGRNEILVEAIRYGAPLRQLSRLTGISYGVIQRINNKMKVRKVGQ